jgi:hypothetical protein
MTNGIDDEPMSFWKAWLLALILGALCTAAITLSGCPTETDGDPDGGDVPHWPMPMAVPDGGASA